MERQFNQKMIKVDQVAVEYHTSRRTVYRWIEKGMPAHKILGTFYFNVDEITDWMCKHSVEGDSKENS